MALFYVSHPPWLRPVGVKTSYIHFSNISWTPRVLDPITNPFLGPSSWLHPASLCFSLNPGASSTTSFLTPPTVSYTCQHPRILPALLGCHSKSGHVWPHGMEPIISKLSRRPCNQGELPPSPTLGGSHSHLPGSKQGHSYLTYL